MCKKHYLRQWRHGSTEDPSWIKYPNGTKLTLPIVRELLAYDPNTGTFTWKVNPSKKVRAGEIVGYKDSDGYNRMVICKLPYLGHRLAWFWMTGQWPTQEIDHKNTVRGDDRWENLRPATRTFNAQNRRRARSDSSTGLMGATPNKKGFMAKITVNGKNIHLGTYATKEQAHAIYIAAKRKFHPGNTL